MFCCRRSWSLSDILAHDLACLLLGSTSHLTLFLIPHMFDFSDHQRLPPNLGMLILDVN